MIYTPLTKKAMSFAYEAHQGQKDRSGVPYIFHPIHLAEQMPDELTTCIAMLHDILEDTEVTLEELEQEFPPEVTEVVAIMTRDPQEDYEDYVRRTAQHPLARLVKIADVRHNSDPSRLIGSQMSEETQIRLRKKYVAAKEILGIE